MSPPRPELLRLARQARQALVEALPPLDTPLPELDRACRRAVLDLLCAHVKHAPWLTEQKSELESLVSRHTPTTLAPAFAALACLPEELAAVTESFYDGALERGPEGRFSLTAQGEERKRTGAWYTPAALVEPTIRRALGEAKLRTPVGETTVLDPTMGGGTWLLAAYRELVLRAEIGVRSGSDPVARVEAARAVFGLDLDPVAVAAARRVIWLASGGRADWGEICAQLQVADVFTSVGWSGTGAAPGAFDWRAWSPTTRGGFTLVVGNPPWDALRPDRRSFFTARDPSYETLTRTAQKAREEQLFAADPTLAGTWAAESARYAALRAWARGETPGHPGFHLQGEGDLNAYKLVLEIAWALVAEGGCLGMVLPNALLTDLGSGPLRRALFDEGRVRWVYGFENRARVFAIDGRYRFAVVLAEKAPPAVSFSASFLRHDPEDWALGAPPSFVYPLESRRVLSPTQGVVVEAESAAELDTLVRLHRGAGELGAWSVRYATELHTTQDAGRFIPRSDADADGTTVDPAGFWRAPGGRVLLPVIEGRMVGAFDPSLKAWQQGRGRKAIWTEVPWQAKRFGPQYLLDAADTRGRKPGPRVAYMRVASATNERSMIATVLHGRAPAADSVFLYVPAEDPLRTSLMLVGVFNSFTYDFLLRARLGGNNLSEFVIAEVPVPPPERCGALVPLVACLAMAHESFAPEWLTLREQLPPDVAPLRSWATRLSERRRLRAMIDAHVALAYGLTEADLAWILRDCDHDEEVDPRALPPKGFWRVDRELAAADRLPQLVRRAFASLTRWVARTGSADGWTWAHPEGPAVPPTRGLPDAACWARIEESAARITAAGI